VDVQRLARLGRRPTDGTSTTLGRQHFLILFQRKSKLSLQMPFAIGQLSLGTGPISLLIFCISLGVGGTPFVDPVNGLLRVLSVALVLGSQVAGLAVVAVAISHALHLVEHVERFQLAAFPAFLQPYWPPFCTYERTKSSAFSSSTSSIS